MPSEDRILCLRQSLQQIFQPPGGDSGQTSALISGDEKGTRNIRR